MSRHGGNGPDSGYARRSTGRYGRGRQRPSMSPTVLPGKTPSAVLVATAASEAEDGWGSRGRLDSERNSVTFQPNINRGSQHYRRSPYSSGDPVEIDDNHAGIVREVQAAIAANDLVVVGMTRNPHVKRARKDTAREGHRVQVPRIWQLPRGLTAAQCPEDADGMTDVPVGGASDLQALIDSGDLKKLLPTTRFLAEPVAVTLHPHDPRSATQRTRRCDQRFKPAIDRDQGMRPTTRQTMPNVDESVSEVSKHASSDCDHSPDLGGIGRL